MELSEAFKLVDKYDLTLRQLRVYAYLYNNFLKLCTRQEIIKACWPKVVVKNTTVDVIIKRLREKLGECFETVHTTHKTEGGYRLVSIPHRKEGKK